MHHYLSSRRNDSSDLRKYVVHLLRGRRVVVRHGHEQVRDNRAGEPLGKQRRLLGEGDDQADAHAANGHDLVPAPGFRGDGQVIEQEGEVPRQLNISDHVFLTRVRQPDPHPQGGRRLWGYCCRRGGGRNRRGSNNCGGCKSTRVGLLCITHGELHVQAVPARAPPSPMRLDVLLKLLAHQLAAVQQVRLPTTILRRRLLVDPQVHAFHELVGEVRSALEQGLHLCSAGECLAIGDHRHSGDFRAGAATLQPSVEGLAAQKNGLRASHRCQKQGSKLASLCTSPCGVQRTTLRRGCRCSSQAVRRASLYARSATPPGLRTAGPCSNSPTCHAPACAT
mmetsp:Transcript_11726/g.41913  ORF Transcript_11726/g.41913 Transcript_11726/m.41913 type:complete len:337 (+) Transcript_11726:1280-2290(+)